MSDCQCGSGIKAEICCIAIHRGQAIAATAEALMRSRYVAFVLCDEQYLLSSWHPDHRPASVEFNPDQRWLGLKIKKTAAGTESDEQGMVEFVARYKLGGKGHRLHEVSDFVRVDGLWVYLEGRLLEAHLRA